MDVTGFKLWLTNNNIYENDKVIRDTVSRAKRVEEAFQAAHPDFSFRSEYDRGDGKEFLSLISRRGVRITENILLPIGSNQMDSIVAATKKYFVFLATNK